MTLSLYKVLLALLGAGFAIAFGWIVMPPLIASGDIAGGLAAGFVNPYAAGYSLDTITCWWVLAVWVSYERKRFGVRHGGWALALGLAPGVATGFALYLWLRVQQDDRFRIAA